MVVLTPPNPNVPESSTKSPVNCSLKMLWIDALADEAKIVMKPTRATPIINAAAVVEVRRGFRMAFSRANAPETPGKGAGGRRRRELMGGATGARGAARARRMGSAPGPP